VSEDEGMGVQVPDGSEDCCDMILWKISNEGGPGIGAMVPVGENTVDTVGEMGTLIGVELCQPFPV
jgi:hypothetical protein